MYTHIHYIFLSIYLPIYLSTYLSIYLPIYLPIYLSIYLSPRAGSGCTTCGASVAPGCRASSWPRR